MKRLLALIALLFAVAAVTGATAANAMAFSVASNLVLAISTDDVCVDQHAPPSKGVTVKQCGKMKNGLAIPCDPLPGLMPAQGHSDVVESAAVHDSAKLKRPLFRLDARQFRPPRAALSA